MSGSCVHQPLHLSAEFNTFSSEYLDVCFLHVLLLPKHSAILHCTACCMLVTC